MRVELLEDAVYRDVFDVFLCERRFWHILFVKLDIDRPQSVGYIYDVSQTFDFDSVFFVVDLQIYYSFFFVVRDERFG